MDSLLFLCHRIPYPPNKGDKIRSFHILKFLAGHYRVHLGTFIDDPADLAHVGKLRGYCADVHAVQISPGARRLLSLTGLLTGEALSLPYYRDAGMRDWVRQTMQREHPALAFVYSSAMAQYVMERGFEHVTRVVDFVDVDSEKWRAYAAMKPWPMSWVYAREADRLLAFERKVADAVDSCVFVSGDEARLFERLRGAAAGNVHAVNNGVDLEYFSAAGRFENPYPAGAPVLVFTGAMDYWANADAVGWFATEIFPLLRARVPAAEFWIVGARPTADVRQLAQLPQVHVTGSVDDIRPYLAHAKAAVAPLRIARGVQNKVLEAMAMGKPVVGTPAAFEGLELAGRYQALTAEVPAAFAERCVELLANAHDAYGPVGRDYVTAHHDWSVNMCRLHGLMVQ